MQMSVGNLFCLFLMMIVSSSLSSLFILSRFGPLDSKMETLVRDIAGSKEHGARIRDTVIDHGELQRDTNNLLKKISNEVVQGKYYFDQKLSDIKAQLYEVDLGESNVFEVDFDPKVTHVEIDIYPKCQPLLPVDESWAILVFEPLHSFLECPELKKEKLLSNVLTVAASVAKHSGIVSISLPENTNELKDVSSKNNKIYVPTMTLHTVLSSIPTHILIDFIKIEGQENDLEIVKSAGQSLALVRKYQVEAQTNKANPESNETDNSKQSHIDFFTSRGFSLESSFCKEGTVCETEQLIFARDEIFLGK
eukprot:TRINITY_DN2847_c0_g1_i1.p1 TRINITY_DN2847_c0_g1~~TRINITY_DN2847_c0_g1_i1.p1  ORF type:complete len:308 (-),score=48.40 TRINITY_DN2847_c0_g1_i1:197-1120(-)